MAFDFCGIGNSCIDIIACVDDQFLSEWNFPKSICSYLSLEQADALEAALPAPQYIAGGCAANVASIIAALGGKASFIGRVANDSIGNMFIDDMAARGIHYPCKPDETESAGSTRVFAFITADSERTFAAYYGVQEDLSVADLDENSIRTSKFMYLDGYALNSRRSAEAFLKAADMAHKAGQRVVFSPSDISILKNYPDDVAAIEKSADIILTSQQEARFMAGTEDRDEALRYLQSRFSSGSMSIGVEGVLVFQGDHSIHVPAVKPPAAVIDTNGAGDAFAGGFLFGLARNMGLEKAAMIGNRCAASIITHAGARPVGDYKMFLEDAP